MKNYFLIFIIYHLSNSLAFADSLNKKEPIFDDDLVLIEIYDKNKFEEEFKKYPNEIIEFFGKNSNNVSRAEMAGQYMSIEFNRSAKGQAKFPGRMIKAMAMYEFLYIDRLRDVKKSLLRYKEKKKYGIF